MKKIFILLLCLSSSLFAQDKFTVSGFVKELSSSEELIGANIVCEQLRIGATTNSYGFYSITLPQGTYSFRYSFIGFQDKVFEVVLNKSQRLDIVMEPYAQ